MPEVPKARPALLGDSGPGLMACEVDQCSQATRARVRGPAVSTGSPRRFGLWTVALRGQPALPGNSRLGPMALRVFQLSRMTCTSLRGPVGSTSCPG